MRTLTTGQPPGEQAETIRTLIVDDHPVIRFGIRHMLAGEPDIEVVGELQDLRGAGPLVAELDPHVVLLDLELGGTNGVEALREFHTVAPGVRVIIYTSHSDEERIVAAAELGVNGYLLKGCPRREIISAIRSARAGGTPLEASVAAKLLHRMNRRANRALLPAIEFSQREIQVLEQMAVGKANRAVGAALGISESTVKFHVHAILTKLHATNRTEAVSIATKQGLLKPPS